MFRDDLLANNEIAGPQGRIKPARHSNGNNGARARLAEIARQFFRTLRIGAGNTYADFGVVDVSLYRLPLRI